MSDEASALVPTVMEQGDDFTIVATSPKEMQAAQQSMILWAARKIQGEKELMKEAKEQYDLALSNNWGSTGWQRRINISEEKIEYYRKIKSALEAGYYIVPPFPMSVFAIRTEKKAPDERLRGWADIAIAERHGISARAVKQGLGQYVSNKVWTRPFKNYVKGLLPDSPRVEQTYHAPDQFRRVEFPFKLAKSAVMSETARAMALKVFDQIGIMGPTPAAAAVPDPIVCGQIMSWFHKKQPITFFIAWWLDTSTM